MIKRFNKKQGSKQGIILLTVVFILAMAVIFISACMLMTQATRNRMYWKAEQSQARLTVTSAAEAFYQALEVGDFKESDLKKLASQSTSGIYMTAKDSSNKYLPGMSMDPDNCTLLSLKTNDADCSEIYAYLVTTIGDETERVKITFTIKEEPTIGGLFNNSCDFNGKVDNLNFDDYGYVIGGGKKDDNFLVIRKGAGMQDSTCHLWCNVAFTGTDNITKFQTAMMGSDLVFMGTGTYSSTASLDSPAGYLNNWYFVGKSGASSTDALSGTVGVDTLKANAVFFANRNSTNISNVNNAPVYTMTVDVNNNVSAPSLLSGSIALSDDALNAGKAYVKKYTSQSFIDQIGEYPTVDQAFSQISVGGSALSKTAPSSYKSYTVSTLITKFANTTAGGSKILGDEDGDGVPEYTNIKITNPSEAFGDYNGSDLTYTFLLDGNSNYIIYFSGTGTFGLYQTLFAVVNPNSSCKQVFVLEPGANLVIGNQNAKNTTGLLGFVSVSRDANTSSGAAYTTYLNGKTGSDYNLIAEQTQTTAAGGKFSKYYDSVKQPTIYILGAGNNQVKFCKQTILEAYLGLFNPASSANTSKISCLNNSLWFYGRMMADGFTTADGGAIYGPYCPGPNKGGSKPDVEPYKFGYSVVSVDYYYVD